MSVEFGMIALTLIASGNEAIGELNCPGKSGPPAAAFEVLISAGPCYFWPPRDPLFPPHSRDHILDRQA
jgi:hypothetical protein